MDNPEEMTETVQTRLTPDQKRSALASARSLGLTLSAFVRMAVLSKSKEVGE
jgi:antitoxin component of RelBE/YafQ-DinJ toxin-antitoxin module